MNRPRNPRKQKGSMERRKFYVSKITAVVFGIFIILVAAGSSIYSVRAQPQGNPNTNDDPSPEDVGTRHVPNYRHVPIATGIQGLVALFGSGNDHPGFFQNRMGDTLAPELIDYYALMLPISMLNMPEDTAQQYLLNMQQGGNQIAGAILQGNQGNDSDDIYLSNVDRDKCNHAEGFITECLAKGLFTQKSTIESFASSIQRSYNTEVEKVLRDGGGMLPRVAKGVGTDLDGQSSPAVYVNSPNMPVLLTQMALNAFLSLIGSQHGVPGDVGSDAGLSLPPIQESDTENIENPSHGPIDHNPQLPDDFGIGDTNPFDEWGNFDSSPWLGSTQNQMQQTIDDFGDIGAPDDEGRALACLPLQRLANVADILGTERTQGLMGQDVDNINCLPNKPGTSWDREESIHPLCTAQRPLTTVTDTALILGLPNKYHGVRTWYVYLWPEEALRDYTGNIFTDNSCVWVVSAQNDAAFIGNQDNTGIIQRVREDE